MPLKRTKDLMRVGRPRTGVVSALFLGAAVVVGGCHETSSVGTNPDQVACRFDVAPSSLLLDLSGAAGRITVSTPVGCTWTATTDVDWIKLIPPIGGSGSGTVSFSVLGNISIGAIERTGSVIIAGQPSTFFTQLADKTPCTYTLDPGSQTMSADGGAGSPVGVSTSRYCHWTAASDVPWITVTAGAAGRGNGVVAFSVAANTGTTRTGTLTIAGHGAMISQTEVGVAAPLPPSRACPYTISPTSSGENWIAATGTVAVTTAGTCPWTATSNVPWITIVSGGSGTGNGVVTYAVATNLTGASRTGTLTIAGLIYSVPQGRMGPLPPPQ
jgi:all-beta uncharacterized protein/BACON domain-containing protein